MNEQEYIDYLELINEGLSFDLSHEDVVEQLLPMFEKEAYVVLSEDLIEGEEDWVR